MISFVGKTALVTGASAGIGREIARILAREVDTLVLVARRRERLDELGTDLLVARPGLRVLVRPCDLGSREETDALLASLEAEGVCVDVFVNNAGFGDYGLFDTRPWDKLERMLALNVVAATYLLHRLLPGMISRGSGAVMNVGSSAGMMPSPGGATYAATKAYLNHLSEALRGELEGTGVTLTVVCPGPVPTEFQAVAETHRRKPLPEVLRIDAVQCAEEAVLALKRGRTRVITGAVMRAAVTVLEAVPKVLLRPSLRRSGARIRRGE
jgi:short-subunit dehydrogenase